MRVRVPFFAPMQRWPIGKAAAFQAVLGRFNSCTLLHFAPEACLGDAPVP
jgi:hypothetical protein